MAASPYSYRAHNSLVGELAETVAPRPPSAGDAPAQPEPAVGTPAPTVREPLDRWAQGLMRSLPGGVSLEVTARRYPHVVNRLAVIWADPRAVDRYLHGLLIDDRNNRQGFEFDALSELVDLRDVLRRMLAGRA